MTITALPTAPARSDPPATFITRADALMAALSTLVTEVNAATLAMNLNATSDTSASSVAIGTGAKTFTVSAGKSFLGGMFLVIADTAAPSNNYMVGEVTSYSGTSLVMNVTSIKGSGTKTAWTISQSVPLQLNEARGSVAMHATTMDLWAQPNVIDGTSTAATVTAIANAPQAGARRTLYPVAGSIITQGATFAVDGGASATAETGDKWEFEAVTTSTYKVHITKASGTAVAASGHGQCRLTKSGANLLLSPYGGNKLVINGVTQTIPDAGVTLGGSVAADGFYYIYAYMSGGTMTLEASTTARATSTTTGNKGVEIKSGDDTRTLVGAAYNQGDAWFDTASSRSVISWFNRRNISSRAWLTTGRTVTSTSIAEINTEARAYFLTWSDEAASASACGSASNSSANQYTYMAVGWDGVAALGGYAVGANPTATSPNSLAASAVAAAGQLTEAALHYGVLGGAVTSGTGTYTGAADNSSRCELTVMLRG